MDNLETLKKAFILKMDAENADISELINKTIKYCKIDENGYVIITEKESKTMKIYDRIMLVLAARYLANKLQNKTGEEASILEHITSDEIARMLNEKKNVIAARIKELKDDKKVISVSRGIFKIMPYVINEFLNSLDKKSD